MQDQFIHSVAIDWSRVSSNSYLRTIKALQGLEQLTLHKAITFFAGENGSGKSTLLEAIAIAAGFNPEGGTRNYHFSTCDSHSELHKAIRLTRGYRRPLWGYFLRAESFYNVASKEEEYADFRHPSEKLHEKSHGESFLLTAQKHLTENGLYILDEPEAALSPQGQLTLLAEIYECSKQQSQFIIATHSPVLLGIPDAEILFFDKNGVHACKYEETEHYLVMKMFINNREQILKNLLEPYA